jgi:hypothetical protein
MFIPPPPLLTGKGSKDQQSKHNHPPHDTFIVRGFKVNKHFVRLIIQRKGSLMHIELFLFFIGIRIFQGYDIGFINEADDFDPAATK